MMIKPVAAPPPFDNPKADVVLRSSDEEPVDFRTFKLLLSLSSSFFSEIFMLPQPSDPNSSIYSEECVNPTDTPVIQMTEDKETLRLLLGLCMPISVHPTSRFSSLQGMQTVIEAAYKFEMEGILKYLRGELMSPRFIESQPLRVFATAYRYGWDTEARKAARFTLRYPIDIAMSYVSELEEISAAAFHKLQEYHRTCGEVACARARLQPAVVEYHDTWTWIACTKCPAAWDTDNKNYPAARKWWVDWIGDIAEELRVKPWGESVRKWDFLKRALTAAAICSNCSQHARDDLEAFSLMLAVEIEREISKVDLEIALDDWTVASPII